jgi:hypothetical protein|eukprot:2756263-Prymnesium_polylepis.1
MSSAPKKIGGQVAKSFLGLWWKKDLVLPHFPAAVFGGEESCCRQRGLPGRPATLIPARGIGFVLCLSCVCRLAQRCAECCAKRGARM